MGGAGPSLGPDLLLARTKGRRELLSSILEPSANISPEFATCIVRTKDDENIIGIKTDDNPDTITLTQSGGIQQVWPKLNLVTIRTETWSLMPDGLERGLSLQDMADLLDYLMTAAR